MPSDLRDPLLAGSGWWVPGTPPARLKPSAGEMSAGWAWVIERGAGSVSPGCRPARFGESGSLGRRGASADRACRLAGGQGSAARRRLEYRWDLRSTQHRKPPSSAGNQYLGAGRLAAPILLRGPPRRRLGHFLGASRLRAGSALAAAGYWRSSRLLMIAGRPLLPDRALLPAAGRAGRSPGGFLPARRQDEPPSEREGRLRRVIEEGHDQALPEVRQPPCLASPFPADPEPRPRPASEYGSDKPDLRASWSCGTSAHLEGSRLQGVRGQSTCARPARAGHREQPGVR